MEFFVFLLPEVLLTITLLGVLFGESYYRGEKFRLALVTTWIGLFGALVQSLLSLLMHHPERYLMDSLFGDGLTQMFRFLTYFFGFSYLASVHLSSEFSDDRKIELSTLLLTTLIPVSLIVGAGNLVSVFLGLQLQFIMMFFLISFKRGDLSALKASGRFALYHLLASAFFVAGMVLFFVQFGTLKLDSGQIQTWLSVALSRPISALCFLMFLFSFFIWLGWFPFQNWFSKAMGDSSYPVMSFLTLGSKLALIGWMIRFFVSGFSLNQETGNWLPPPHFDWTHLLGIVLGVGTLILSYIGLAQKRLRVSLSYLLSINLGFFTFALLNLNLTSLNFLIYGLTCEVVAWSGLAVLLTLFEKKAKTDDLDQLKTVSAPVISEAVGVILFLLLISGFFGTTGFLTRFSLIKSMFDHNHSVVAGIAVMIWLSTLLFSLKLSRPFASLLRAQLQSSEARSSFFQSDRVVRLFWGGLLVMIGFPILSNWVLTWIRHSLTQTFW